MNKRLLSLDLSTKTCGICLMESVKIQAQKNIHKCKIVELTHISPRPRNPKPKTKLEGMFRKVDMIKEFLSKYKESNVSNIVIEEPLISSNNIFTSSILVKFNGMVSKTIFDLFGIIPEYLSAYDSRKYGFPELMSPRKFKKNGEKIIKLQKPVLFGDFPYESDKKMIIWDKVSKLFPEIQWAYNKNNVLSKESFDMSDSVATAISYGKINNWWI